MVVLINEECIERVIKEHSHTCELLKIEIYTHVTSCDWKPFLKNRQVSKNNVNRNHFLKIYKNIPYNNVMYNLNKLKKIN